MNVFRITRNKHLKEDLTGKGASIFPGRWNLKDVFCIYTAESRALALLEHMANISRENYIRSAFTMRTFFIPDECILKVSLDDLPSNWRERPPPVSTREFGARLIESKESLAYFLPSVIIPQERNILIDPFHPDMKKLRIENDQLIEFDMRLKN